MKYRLTIENNSNKSYEDYREIQRPLFENNLAEARFSLTLSILTSLQTYKYIYKV